MKKPKKNLVIEMPLYELMAQRNVSVAELSKRTGMSRQAIYYLLNRPPSSIYISTITRICAALDVDPGTLLQLKEVPE